MIKRKSPKGRKKSPKKQKDGNLKKLENDIYDIINIIYWKLQNKKPKINPYNNIYNPFDPPKPPYKRNDFLPVHPALLARIPIPPAVADLYARGGPVRPGLSSILATPEGFRRGSGVAGGSGVSEIGGLYPETARKVFQ